MNKQNKSLPAKKRSYEDAVAAALEDARDGNDDDLPTEAEMASMSRSERKRHREKKRRSDVNKGFDELMGLLLDIDPEVRADAEDRAAKGQCKRSLGAHEDNVLSRVDLISTAIRVLKRTHTENELHKKIIQDLVKSKSSTEATPKTSPRPLAASTTGHGGGSALSDLGFAGTSQLDRAYLLQQSVAAQQLRAVQHASLLGGTSGFSNAGVADLMALRARSNASAAAANESRLLAQLNSHRHQLLQSALAGSSAGAGAASGITSSFGAEALYGALSGGTRTMPIQSKKTLTTSSSPEEELRRIRAERMK